MHIQFTGPESVGFSYCKGNTTLSTLSFAVADYYDLTVPQLIGENYRDFFETLYIKLMNAGIIRLERATNLEHVFYKLRTHTTQRAMFVAEIRQVILPNEIRNALKETFTDYTTRNFLEA